MEVVDGERDDDDEGQDEAQDEGEGLLQALPLVGDALVGCENKTNTVSVVRWLNTTDKSPKNSNTFQWSCVLILWSYIIIVGLSVGLFLKVSV